MQMQRDQPVVSVVIPTWNRAATIGRAVDSVLRQTFGEFEVLVVDDGSTDGTGQLFARHTDQRVRYLPTAVHRGAQAARNRGVREARGEWIAFLDSDDTWHPRRLAAALSEAGRGDRVQVVCSNGLQVEPDGTQRNMRIHPPAGSLYAGLLAEPGPLLQGLLVRRTTLLGIGGLTDGLQAFQEWDTHIRLAAVCEFAWVEEPLFHWLRHTGDSISNDYVRNATGFAQVVEAHAAETLRHCGPGQLAAHYAQCATLFGKLHDHRQEARFLRKALSLEVDRELARELEHCLHTGEPLVRKFAARVCGQ